MRRTVCVAMLAVLTLTLTSSASAAASKFRLYPDGISPRDIIAGLYRADDPGWCCWVGSRAVLSVPVPAGADAVIVTILIPSYAANPKGTAIAASFDGVPAPRVCCFFEGVSQMAFDLPQRSNRNRRVIVQLAPSTHFVPARLGMGTDSRTLSVLLQSLVVENMVTGQRYLDGTPASSNSGGLPYAVYLTLLIALGAVSMALTLRRAAWGWIVPLAVSPLGLSAIAAIGTAVGLVLARLGSTQKGWPRFTRSSAPVIPSYVIPSLSREAPPSNALRDRRFVALAAAFALFLFSMVISGLRAEYRHPALEEIVKNAAYLLVFVVGVLAFRADPDRDLLRTTLAIVTTVVAAIALLEPWYGTPESRIFMGHAVARVAGILEGPNQLGAFLGLALPLLLSLVLGTRLRGWERTAFLLGTAALLLTFSRAGIGVALFAGALVLLLRLPVRAWVLGASVLLWLAGGAVTVHDATLETAAAQGIDVYNGGLGTRPALWRAATSMWRADPVLGVGPGNYQLRVSAFAPGVRTHANSYYLQVLAEEGAVGFALYLLLIGTTIAAVARRGDALAIGVLAVVIGFALHQLVDGLAIYPKVGDLYWMLIGTAM